MVKRLILGWVLAGLFSLGTAQAEDENLDKQQLFNSMHQAGIRLGVWGNRGGMPLKTGSTFKTNFKDASFYLEGYFGYRLFSQAVLEFSLGMVNRGTVTFIEANTTNVGNVLVYPILVQLKLYPLSSLRPKLQPYLMAGGGLYYGRRSVQLTTSGYAYYGLSEQTGTNFSYAVGGGIDWPIGTTIGLEANVKYMSIEFSKGLQTVSNYDAIAFTVGVKYLYLSKK